MSDHSSADGRVRAHALVLAAEELIAAAPNDMDPGAGKQIGTMLDALERATPGGAPLHAQLDAVRKWVDALGRPEEHARFGGTAHVRDHVLAQLRRVRAATEDYFRETR
jgi:hypothetical protein